MTRHHRKPRSKNGATTKQNISLVPESKHVAYHHLFDTKDPREIAEELSRVWIDPMYTMVAFKRDQNQIVVNGIVFVRLQHKAQLPGNAW
jgi:hypothetical protein